MGFFSVQSDSFPPRSRTTNPVNLLTSTISKSLLDNTIPSSNQINNVSRNWQPPSGGPGSKTSSTIPKVKSASKQCTPRPCTITKETKKLIQERLRGTLSRPRSKTMTTLFPPDMMKPAMISTNRTRYKPTKPSRKQAKRPHQSSNQTAGTPNINAWTKRNSRH